MIMTLVIHNKDETGIKFLTCIRIFLCKTNRRNGNDVVISFAFQRSWCFFTPLIGTIMALKFKQISLVEKCLQLIQTE